MYVETIVITVSLSNEGLAASATGVFDNNAIYLLMINIHSSSHGFHERNATEFCQDLISCL